MPVLDISMTPKSVRLDGEIITRTNLNKFAYMNNKQILTEMKQVLEISEEDHEKLDKIREWLRDTTDIAKMKEEKHNAND